jgi:hypothetical protein
MHRFLMRSFARMTLRLAILFALSVSAYANNFRVADLVYLPAGGRVANFNTDIYLSNPNNERVSVSVAFAPQGVEDNSAATEAAHTLTVMEPGERRAIFDPLKTIFGLDAGLGQFIFFGCREGAPNCDCAASPGDCRGISVEARVYATSSNCPNGATACTTGQLFSGLPWYAYASKNAANGYDKVFIAGVRHFGGRGVGGFRTNIGVTNASQYSFTELRVALFDSRGAQLAAGSFQLGPLGQAQKGFSDLFPSAADITTSAYVVVEQASVTPTANAAANGCADGCPGFFAYGSQLDNLTDDATTLEAQFFPSIGDTQLNCFFASHLPARPARRR